MKKKTREIIKGMIEKIQNMESLIPEKLLIVKETTHTKDT